MGEALGGFVGTARVLFRSKLGAPTTSELFNVGLDAAGGYGLPHRIGTDLARLLGAGLPGRAALRRQGLAPGRLGPRLLRQGD